MFKIHFFISQEIESPAYLIEQTNECTLIDWFHGFIDTSFVLIVTLPQISAIFASIDGVLEG